MRARRVTGQVALTSELATEEAAVEDALGALVREHARFVYKVAYAVLRKAADAEDAAQETFVRVMRHREKIGGVQDVRAWLARIAWRIAVDRRRAAGPYVTEEEAAEALDRVRTSGKSAEEMVITAQMLGLLQSLIEQLPRELREVVTLSTVEEMRGSEIAAALGIPEASVRTRLFRARQLLKEKFAALLARREEKK